MEKNQSEGIGNANAISIDASKISNPLLKRLIEEVKNDNPGKVHFFDRAHNRHNRGR